MSDNFIYQDSRRVFGSGGERGGGNRSRKGESSSGMTEILKWLEMELASRFTLTKNF